MLNMEFRGGGPGGVTCMAAGGRWAGNKHTVFRYELVDDTLVFTAKETDTQFWQLHAMAPLPNGVAAIDMATKTLHRLRGAHKPTLTADLVTGSAFNCTIRDGPRRKATMRMPRTVVTTSSDGYIFSDMNTVRYVDHRDVSTMCSVPSHITALTPSGLGLVVFAGTMIGSIYALGPSIKERIAVLPGPVDALLATTAHVIIAAVNAPGASVTRIYTIDVRTGARRVRAEMQKRSHHRPPLLAWCGNRVVAIGRHAHVFLDVEAPNGRPVLQCHHADWRHKHAWTRRALSAARVVALGLKRRHNTPGAVGLPPELTDMVLHWLFILWPHWL